LAGTPAHEAGLQKGDRIVAIDGTNVDAFALWQLEDELKKAGTSVSLTIMRDNQTLIKTMVLKTLL